MADPPVLRQASCVAIGCRALIIEGPSGSGKSSLALALIDRGAVLVGDDGVMVERRGRSVWASPPPNITGKLEIRSVGLVELPYISAPLALILRLERDPPRFVERADTSEICGTAIPCLAFYPDSPVAAIRAEYALERHGLAAAAS
ncbi:MAG: HPr kinase/phosphatase C-terminal domain-containing protein [Alteripontixanthobacter sp.]